MVGVGIEPADPARRGRFEALFETYYDSVRGFVARRAEVSAVEDAVAETFLVAWRRLDDVEGDPLPWLLGVARRVIANQLRGERRRHDLLGRLRDFAVESEPAWIAPEEMSDQLALAMGALTAPEREALLLVAWDGLSTAQAASVAACSAAAFRVRLHRARRRLAAGLEQGPDTTPRASAARATAPLRARESV